MKNILVTGGAGFIGSNFIHYLSANSAFENLVNLDALTYAGSLENLREIENDRRYTFIHGNICDRELVQDLLRRYEIDTIVHFAAESHVDRSILAPDQFIQTNIVGTFNLLEAARQVWINQPAKKESEFHFHHISTDEVFGALRPEDPAFTETTPYSPNSPYAASKASCDHLVRAYFQTYRLPVTITNCSNNYGPRQFPEKLIPLMIMNALDGKALPVYGDGQQIRDWLYVDDHCEAILKVIAQGNPGQSYNVGGGNQPANIEIVETLCDILDELAPVSACHSYKKLIQFVTDRPGHDRRYATDITKIKSKLHWQPHYSLKDGLTKTVQWYLDHLNWVETIRQRNDYQGWIKENYQKKAVEK